MSESRKKCFLDNCADEPIYFCYCGEIPTFTCENHAHVHCKLKGDHHYEQIYSEIHEDVRKAALKHFYKLKSGLKYYQSKIIQTELTLINQIHSITQNVLQKIKLQNQKFNEYIAQICNIKTIDNSKLLGFIESLLKLTPKDTLRIRNIELPKFSIANIKHDFSDTFKLDDFIEQKLYIEKISRNGPHTMKFIAPYNNISILSIFDTKHMLINNIRLEIDKNIRSTKMRCMLPDGSLFYDSYNFGPFLIDPELHIKMLPHHPKKHEGVFPVYFENEIYIIGGSFSQNSIKYNFDQNKWLSIAQFPIDIGEFTISAVFKNYILLGNDYNSTVIYYDTIIDSYSEISSLSLVKNNHIKAFLVENEAVYILTGSVIYKSIDNLISWSIVGDCSILEGRGHIMCSPITYNNKIYFLMNFKIFSFDLKNMNLRLVYSFDLNHMNLRLVMLN